MEKAHSDLQVFEGLEHEWGASLKGLPTVSLLEASLLSSALPGSLSKTPSLPHRRHFYQFSLQPPQITSLESEA